MTTEVGAEPLLVAPKQVTFQDRPEVLGEAEMAPAEAAVRLPPRLFPLELPPMEGAPVEKPPFERPEGEKPVTETELADFKKKLEEMTKQFQTWTTERKPAAEEADIRPVQPLREIDHLYQSPFILLPALDGVQSPIHSLSGDEAEYVAVASRPWLHDLDQMRAAGWQYYDKDFGIEVFLLRSAWVLKQNLNYNVIQVQSAGRWVSLDEAQWISFGDDFEEFKKYMLSRQLNYRNLVEQFALYYPEQSRQQERIAKGLQRLRKDIANALGGRRALLPRNYESGIPALMTCPPVESDFYLGDIRVSNFLRHFTQLDFNKTVPVSTTAGGTKEVPTCRPPVEAIRDWSMSVDWIPKEFRAQIEDKYNLTQFKYSTPEFKRFIYTLASLAAGKPNPDLQTGTDDIGQYVTVIDSQGKGYRLYLADVTLKAPVHEGRAGVPDGEMTLREWYAQTEWGSDPAYYPLLHAILNASAPVTAPSAETGQPYGPFAQYIYRAADRGGYKMYADAPVSIFRKQLMQDVLRQRRPGETYVDCRERFVRGIYSRIYAYWAPKIGEQFPKVVPVTYRQILQQLYDYGDAEDQPDFCVSATGEPRAGGLAPSAPPLLPTAESLQTESTAGLENWIKEFYRRSQQATA